MHYKNRQGQPNVFKQPTVIYPVTLQELLSGRGSVIANWTPVPMLGLRRSKEAIVSYGMHSRFMKQMLNLWSVCNTIIPKDWIKLLKSFRACQQLQWNTWLREEAKIIKQWSKARGRVISQDQILGRRRLCYNRKTNYI